MLEFLFISNFFKFTWWFLQVTIKFPQERMAIGMTVSRAAGTTMGEIVVTEGMSWRSVASSSIELKGTRVIQTEERKLSSKKPCKVG